MNTINLVGNICNDLEVKSTNSGKSVMQITLAVNRPFAKDTTDFIPVVVWNQPAEYLGKYAHKGTKVAVSGKLTSRKWEDKDGNKRTAFEVIADAVEICESARESGTEAKNQPSPYIPEAYTSQPKFEDTNSEDFLPF